MHTLKLKTQQSNVNLSDRSGNIIFSCVKCIFGGINVGRTEVEKVVVIKTVI